MASIPPRSAPADYTQFFVDNAISRYETQGLDATLAHYNREESIDGQWYVFIIDENDLLIAHPDPGRLGLDVKGWVGTDANRYRFGPRDALGHRGWQVGVLRLPEPGERRTRFRHHRVHAAQERLGGEARRAAVRLRLVHRTPTSSPSFLVATAARVFREVGLEGTIAYFASPEIVFGGTGCGHRLLQQRRKRRRGLVRVHSRQQRHHHRPLPQGHGWKEPSRRARH